MMTAAPSSGARPGRGHSGEMSTAVRAMYDAFRASPLPLDLPGAASVRVERAQVIEQLEDYVLPRLRGLDAPALVVVCGPTGVGKSTLVNSLVGRKVATPGLLRPTTRSPVLVHHPGDRTWFGPDRILPTLERTDRPTNDQRAIQLVATPAAPRGLAILDAPDFDSIDDRNRELATKLLAAADLWLFVTSAARYADQVPWQQLAVARERETPVAVVMNRIPPEDKPTVSTHLARMLRASGVASDTIVLVEHGPIDRDGLLPAPYVAAIKRWLGSVARDLSTRSAIVNQAVGGAIRQSAEVACRVADAAALQVEAVSQLLTLADQAYAAAAEELHRALSDGTLVRGELWTQWQELIGAHDVVPSPADTMRALRERLATPGPEDEARIDRLGLALDLALETLIVDTAERAAARASRALRATEHGAALLGWSTEDLSRPGRGLAARARRSISAWRHQLVARVGEELRRDDGTAPQGDATTRGLAVALVLQAVSTPHLERTGAEPLDRRNARDLLLAAREGVTTTMSALLLEERDRYLEPVLGWRLLPDAPELLRSTARDVARTGLDPRRTGLIA